MNNVIPLKRRGFLAGYISQNSRRRPHEAVFLAGVLIAIVLAETVYCAFGGPVPAIGFAVSALLGSTIGVTIYRRFPYRMVSCVERRSGSQAPRGEDTNWPNAA